MTLTDNGFPPVTPDPGYGTGFDAHEQDSYGQADAEPTTDLTPAEDAAGKTRGSRGGRPRATVKVSARTVRTILAKHAELAAADPADVALLAATLGAKEDIEDLTAHILSTPRLTLAGVAELDSIVEAARIDPLDAVAVAMQHEAQAKAIWAILAAVGLLEGARPSNDGTASVAIARAASRFSAEHTARLDAVRELARKGS